MVQKRISLQQNNPNSEFTQKDPRTYTPLNDVVYPAGLKAAEEYLNDNVQNVFQAPVSKFIFDAPSTIPTRLHRARCKLRTAVARLKKTRTHEEKVRQRFDNEWKAIENKELEFRKCILNFDEFILYNYEKRYRAKIKIEDEKYLFNSRTHECAVISEKLRLYGALKSQLEDLIRKYRKYEDFLGAVIETDKEHFPAVSNIIARYHNLCDTKLDILTRQNEMLLNTFEIRSIHDKMMDDKSVHLIRLVGNVTHMQSRYDNARHRALHWELVFEMVKKRIYIMVREYDDVMYACDSIFHSIWRRKYGKRHSLPVNVPFDRRMHRIKATLTLYDTVLSRLERSLPDIRRRHASRIKNSSTRSLDAEKRLLGRK